MSETDPDWRPINAGLQVLRLVDSWLAGDPAYPEAAPPDVAWQLRSVRATVAELPPTHLARTILSGVVEAIEAADTRSAKPVAPRLMAYGRSLDYDARYSLAADVYRTVILYVAPESDRDLALDARVRLGHCLRKQDKWTDAEALYADARGLADVLDDPTSALHARIGEAAVAFARGNLPSAEAMLDAIIADTDSPALTDVHAMALHDRAIVAFRRTQYEAAAQLAYRALGLTRSLTARDRVLADLANAFTQLGALDSARDAFLILTVTAQEQIVRWNAMVNLLEVSALQTNEPMFEQYRRELLGERLPPSLKAQYHYYTAFGYHALGKIAPAERSLELASELAEAYRYNQLLFQIDELRTAVKRGAATRRRPAADAPAGLREATEAVSEMRQLVGV